jgi:hypothetical protein
MDLIEIECEDMGWIYEVRIVTVAGFSEYEDIIF